MSPGNQDAVSPVVGTILMVAIAVVLSATVFLLVQQLSQAGNDEPPRMGFGVDNRDSEVAIVTAPAGSAQLDWYSDLVLAGSCTPLLNGNPFPTAPGTPVAAGDVLSCAPGDDLRIASTPAQGNALLFQHEFAG